VRLNLAKSTAVQPILKKGGPARWLRGRANRRVTYTSRSSKEAVQPLREVPSAKSYQPIGASSYPQALRYIQGIVRRLEDE
jgi:hypothetical protein